MYVFTFGLSQTLQVTNIVLILLRTVKWFVIISWFHLRLQDTLVSSMFSVTEFLGSLLTNLSCQYIRMHLLLHEIFLFSSKPDEGI